MVAAGASVAAGCATHGPTDVGVPTVSRDWVTGAAAAALGADGRFVLARPTDPGPLEIDEGAARAQAVAWARLVAAMPTSGGSDWFAPGGSGLERDHGAKIPFAQLRDCGRAIYAWSAYGPLPGGLPRPIVNAFGPYWLIRLCSPAGDVPVVLGVAATSALVVSNGRLEPPSPTAATGNEFNAAATWRGTPPARAYPLEPEAVVAFVYRVTGRRVSEVPTFVARVADARPDPIAPQFGLWRVTLEASIRGVGAISGAAYDTREVAAFWAGGVTSDTTLQVALAEQPDTALQVSYTVYPDPAVGGEPQRSNVRLRVRTPYLFEPLRMSPR